MDKRDQELLDKQLRFGGNPPLNQNSVMIGLITVAAFMIGIGIGDIQIKASQYELRGYGFQNSGSTAASFVTKEQNREVPMNRQHVYRQLANNAFEHAAEEQNAQLLAQWKILGARWLELAAQSKNATEKDPLDDPIPWDHRK